MAKRSTTPAIYGRTKAEIRMDWTCHRTTWPLVIPAGTRCRKIPEGGTMGRFWIDDLSWIDAKSHGPLKHDATYYGIDIAADLVDA